MVITRIDSTRSLIANLINRPACGRRRCARSARPTRASRPWTNCCARDAGYDIHRYCEQLRAWSAAHPHAGPRVRYAEELRRLLAETVTIRKRAQFCGSDFTLATPDFENFAHTCAWPLRRAASGLLIPCGVSPRPWNRSRPGARHLCRFHSRRAIAPVHFRHLSTRMEREAA